MLTGTAGLPVSAEEMTGTLGDTMTWTVDGDTVRCTWESAAADGVEISIQGDTCTIEKGVYSWEEYQEWSNAAANELTELLEANGYDPSAMGSEEKNAAIAELMPEAYAVRTAFTGIKHIVVSDGVTQLDAPLDSSDLGIWKRYSWETAWFPSGTAHLRIPTAPGSPCGQSENHWKSSIS